MTEAFHHWATLLDACASATWLDLLTDGGAWLAAFQCLVATNRQVNDLTSLANDAAQQWVQQKHPTSERPKTTSSGQFVHGTPIMLTTS